jgi:hypothetical protein
MLEVVIVTRDGDDHVPPQFLRDLLSAASQAPPKKRCRRCPPEPRTTQDGRLPREQTADNLGIGLNAPRVLQGQQQEPGLTATVSGDDDHRAEAAGPLTRPFDPTDQDSWRPVLSIEEVGDILSATSPGLSRKQKRKRVYNAVRRRGLRALEERGPGGCLRFDCMEVKRFLARPRR